MKIVPLVKTIPLKRVKYILLSVFAMILLLGIGVSCKDKNPDNNQSPCVANPGNCKSVLEAKDFFLFKEGSYWVYEEETSHEIDSSYVVEYENDVDSYDFFVHIKSDLTGFSYRYWPTYYPNISGCSTNGSVTKKCIYINRSKGQPQNDMGETKVFFVNYKIGDFIYNTSSLNYCENSMITVANIHASYHLDIQDFEDVVQIDENCSFQEGNQPIKTFYAKAIGIIRKELIDSNQVWNLINYQVIQ